MLVARIEQGFRAVGFARAEIGFEQAGRVAVLADGGSFQRLDGHGITFRHLLHSGRIEFFGDEDARL